MIYKHFTGCHSLLNHINCLDLIWRTFSFVQKWNFDRNQNIRKFVETIDPIILFFQYPLVLIPKRKRLLWAGRIRCGESGTPSTAIYIYMHIYIYIYINYAALSVRDLTHRPTLVCIFCYTRNMRGFCVNRRQSLKLKFRKKVRGQQYLRGMCKYRQP